MPCEWFSNDRPGVTQKWLLEWFDVARKPLFEPLLCHLRQHSILAQEHADCSQLLATWNMADGDVLTQRLFPNFSELQVRVDGVFMKPRRLDAVDVAVRESTRLAREPRPRRDAVVRHRLLRSSRTTRRRMTKSFLGKRSRNYLLHDWSF